MAEHAAGVGREAGEEAEGLNRLEDSHAAAVEGPAAQPAGGADQFGVDGEVHDVGHPEPRVEQPGGQGQAGVRRHPGRGGVDQAIGAGQHRGERAGFGAPGPARTEPAAEVGRERRRPLAVEVHDGQQAGAEGQGRVRDRGARATRAEQHDLAGGRRRPGRARSSARIRTSRCCGPWPARP